MDGKIDPGEGYRLIEDGEAWANYTEVLCLGGVWKPYITASASKDGFYRFKTAREPLPGTIERLKSTPAPKDPKTKYHRAMYPAWNDTEVHTDANGHKYINVDVYSVLAAFDPGHEVAHAVKKLLAAGTRDKGSKIQDYREAIISIEAAIYRAEIEGGNA